MRRLPRLLRQVASIEVLGLGARKGNAMQLKPVMTWSAEERKARLFRVMWERGTVGDGKGYSAKLAASLVLKLAEWKRYADGWRVTVIGLSLHYRRSYGGRFV